MGLFEIYVSRMTGLSIESLRGDEPLKFVTKAEMRFKRRADAEMHEVSPAAVIAEQLARSLAESVTNIHAFKGLLHAGAVRSHILANRQTATLQSLIDFAWEHGIVVAHMAELPNGSKKFDGIAMFVRQRPVIILGSGRDSPPWIAFHLAHELGHILLGHVAVGTPSLSDDEITKAEYAQDPQEREADRFALEVLTGSPEVELLPVCGLTGMKLANLAQKNGPDRGIDAGVLSLVYGLSAGRIPAAQNAIKHLQQTGGAHQHLADGLIRHLAEDLAETPRMFADLCTES